MSYRVDRSNRANTHKVYGHNDGTNYSLSANVDCHQKPVTTSSYGHYVVPSYSTPGYDNLSHGPAPSGNSGYFQIGRAYGNGSNYHSSSSSSANSC